MIIQQNNEISLNFSSDDKANYGKGYYFTNADWETSQSFKTEAEALEAQKENILEFNQ